MVLGFNTARGDTDEHASANAKRRSKTNGNTSKLSLDEPERIDKAVAKIIN